MNFNSLQFLIFFPVVTLLYFLIPQRVRWVWLLITSYYFYMGWNPRYAVLIATSTVITFISGLLIDRENHRADQTHAVRNKKLWVALSFVLNLAILFFFKYWGFFTKNVIAIGGLFDITIQMPTFDVLLPVGISFYTFQALSYTMDVYRGEIYAERNLFKYALFVSFFPQLVAGPIERSENLLVQVNQPHEFDADRARDGLLLMLWGFFQKVVIADRIATLINHVYGNWTEVAGISIVLATVLFAVQIYCDFGGYSSIAIGAAQVMGFTLMENFKQPYLATSCADFWRRWHISLSSWFRDYLYIPLGGNRKGKWRKYFNNLVTFLVSGLWHGAQWSYVAWGGLNGLYQVIGDILKPARTKVLDALHVNREWKIWKALRILLTFCLIDFAWLFFRAPSFLTGVAMIRRTLTNLYPDALFTVGADGSLGLYTLGLDVAEFWLAIVAILILAVVDILKEKRPLRPYITRLPVVPRWIFYFVSVYVILIFGAYGPGFDASAFIYFQF